MPAGANQGRYVHMFQLMGLGNFVSGNNRAAASVNRLGLASRRTSAGMLGMTSSLVGVGMGFVALGLAARKVIRDYSAYTEAAARVRTTLASQTRNYRQNYEIVRDLSEMAGRRLGYSLAEANDAMDTMLQTGLEIHPAMRIFETSLQLARVAEMETSRSTQFLTDSLNMFRSEAGSSNEEVRHFARRVATQLSVAAAMTSTDIGDLQQAFRYAGGELSSFGYSSREVISTLSALSTMGLRGTTAGTRLRGAMAQLYNPSQRTLDVMRQFGIQETEMRQVFFNEEGRRRNLFEGMTRLSGLFRRMPTEQARATAFFQMFGVRSVAAGQALAGMSESGRRAFDVYERLGSEDVISGSILDTQMQERMHSFGMQMEQLRQGATDMAIAFGEVLFGELGRGNQGFGTTIRNIAAAIRLSGNLNDMTADQRRQWNELSASEQQWGQNLRDLFVNLSDVLRVLGRVSRVILKLVADWPQLTIAILAMRAALGSGGLSGLLTLGSAASSIWRTGSLAGMSTAARGAGGLGGAATAAAPMSRGMSIGMGALGVQVAGLATLALQEAILAGSDMDRDMAHIRQTTVARYSEWARFIPVVGPLVSQFTDLAGTVQETVRVTRELNTARGEEARRLAGTFDESTTRHQGVEAPRNDLADARRRRSQLVSNLAVLYGAQGITSQDQIYELLAASNIGEDEGQRMARSISRQQGAMTPEMMQQQARGMAPTNIWGNISPGGIRTATRNTLRQLVESQSSISDREGAVKIEADRQALRSELAGLPEEMIDDLTSSLAPTIDEDVSEGRGDLTDVLSTLNEISASDLIGWDRPKAEQSVMPPQLVSVEVPVVVQLDGREIARGVGTANVETSERSGVTAAPGQSRRTRESGVDYSSSSIGMGALR